MGSKKPVQVLVLWPYSLRWQPKHKSCRNRNIIAPGYKNNTQTLHSELQFEISNNSINLIRLCFIMCINPEHLTYIFELQMLSLTIWHICFIRLLGFQQSHPSVMLAACSITRCLDLFILGIVAREIQTLWTDSVNAFRKYQLKTICTGQHNVMEKIKNARNNLITLTNVMPVLEEVNKHWKGLLLLNNNAKRYFPRGTHWKSHRYLISLPQSLNTIFWLRSHTCAYISM